MRRSRIETEQTRKRIVAEASRLYRERGLSAVSVPEVMSAAGLTHGGFYGHFSSKEQLAGAAIAAAFDEKFAALAALPEEQRKQYMQRYLEQYLSKGHIESRGMGCPIAGLASEVSRGEDEAQQSMALGVEKSIRALKENLFGEREEAIQALALMVGGIVLARAAGSEKASTEILKAARHAAPVAGALQKPRKKAG